LRTDAAIILDLVDANDGLSEDDTIDLAGLLYHSRNAAAQENVVRAIAILVKEKWIDEITIQGKQRYQLPAVVSMRHPAPESSPVMKMA
jgi:hypothetical protein